ncbi:hypothetical protein KP509_16G072900 [Ceratopteris richardii]|uniref:Uncharacterized protein n=1 Tax=Ceratopteris richardii TaxID=49495 RepID=A0A8T2T5L0_CERRI|nr:hypothetical protein KP509_16G072900 [Ceratopteris richardii]
MILLQSTFLDCNSLVVPDSRIRPTSPLNMRRSGSHSPSAFSASVQQTDEQYYVQRKNAPSLYSWISLLLAGSSSEAPIKPLIEDISTIPKESAPECIPGVGNTNNDAQTGQVKILSKNGPKGGRRVSFTPQKARELRKKMRETEFFHDTMYHSAIAARLASQDD